VDWLEKEGIFSKGTAKILEKDKELRIDNQYYLKNKSVDIDFEKLSDFIISMRNSLDNIHDKEIEKIRSEIRDL